VKYAYIFLFGENFLGNFLLGGKFLDSELFGGNFTLEKFSRFPTQNSFYLSYFLFANSISHVETLRVIVRGKFSPGLNCLEGLSVGRGDFFMGGKTGFPALFKKQSEIIGNAIALPIENVIWLQCFIVINKKKLFAQNKFFKKK
jgi:hypothetical protein